MKFFFLLQCLLSGTALFAENLLRNADFSNVSPAGLPREWEIRQLSGTLEDSVLKLSGKGWVVQSDLTLKLDETYILSYEVRSADASKYRVYCEWKTPGGSTDASPLHLRTGGKDWTRVAIPFVFRNAREPYRSIFALQLPEGGSVEFRNLKLEALSSGMQPVDGKYSWEIRAA